MGAVVTEFAVDVAGYTVVDASLTKTLDASGNVFIFYYTISQYAITYVLNGGVNAATNPGVYDVNDLPVIIAAPTKSGYAFQYWGVTCANGTQLILPASGIPVGTTGDLTLSAIWSFTPISYNIAYNLNGGTVTTGNPTAYNVENRFNINPANLITPIKAGYKFSHWRVLSSLGLFDLPSTGIPIESLGDVTLVAMWELIPVRYSIKYELNGGINAAGNPSEYTVESDFPMFVHNPHKEGYAFSYWIVICSSNGAEFILPRTGIPAGMAENVTLVAYWDPLP